MDIYKAANVTGVDLKTLGKLHKAGLLNVEGGPADPVYVKALANLRKANPLTVEQLLYFLRNPAWLPTLGDHEMKARAQLIALGDPEADAMPAELAEEICEMATGKAKHIDRGATWLTHLIDTCPDFEDGREQRHAFVAIRMLYNLPDRSLPYNVPEVAKALFHCRRNPRCKGYHRTDENGHTQYRRPIVLDL